MNRITKTTLVLLAIVAGTATGTMAQKGPIHLDPVTKNVYELTYRSDGPCRFRVELLDENGKKLLARQIHERKSVVQPFDLSNLKVGAYQLKVTDEGGEFVRNIEKTDEIDMKAAIMKLGDDRAKIIVDGQLMDPVHVSVFDGNDVLIFTDYIERERPFTRIYDLSQIHTNELRIEVGTQQKLLASADF